MTHYPFPDSRGTKIAFAAFFTAMLFLARDSMFTTAVIGFEKAQFLMLGVICLLGVAFLIVNRRNLLQILKDRRMIVAGIAAAVLLLPMLVKRDWQLMYFSVLLCLLTAVFLSYFLTLREAAKYYVAILSVLGAYSVLAAYILRIGVDSGAYAVPVFRNSMGFEFHNFFLSIVPDTYVKNRNFGIFREPGGLSVFPDHGAVSEQLRGRVEKAVAAVAGQRHSGRDDGVHVCHRRRRGNGTAGDRAVF